LRWAAVHNGAMKVKGFFPGIGSPSALALIAANTIPLIGAVFFGWSIFSLMFLFWFENVIIGALNVVRFLGAQPSRDEEAANSKGVRIFELCLQLFFAGFFSFHYGMFCFVHGMFVVSMFGSDVGFSMRSGPIGIMAICVPILIKEKLVYAALAIFISHLFSLCYNYFYKGERVGAELQQIMGRPYGRVVVLHITIILGAVPAKLLGSPIWALVLLVVLKTIVDLKAHLMERNKMAAKKGAGGSLP
jgi:hypothetical protein